VGIAITLQVLAEREISLSEIRAEFPNYVMAKKKVSIHGVDPDAVLSRLRDESAHLQMTDIDGVKIDLDEGWVHLRKSNTEPIIRVYSEAASAEEADALAARYIKRIAEWTSKS
jgi:phosphomannomutase